MYRVALNFNNACMCNCTPPFIYKFTLKTYFILRDTKTFNAILACPTFCYNCVRFGNRRYEQTFSQLHFHRLKL